MIIETREKGNEMSLNHITVWFMGKKDQISQLRNIFKSLGFEKEKEESRILKLEDGRQSLIVSFEATDEQIKAASDLFKYVKVRIEKK